MNILIAIEDLRLGGAQIFGMRLAQALRQRGHQVYLYSHYATYIDRALLARVAPDVPVLAYEPGVPGLDWLLRKVQGALWRLKWPFPARERLVERHLRRTLERLGTQILNSHMIKSDYVAAAAAGAVHPPVPLVISMHGCYEDYLHKPNEPQVIRQARQALRQAAGLVYLTQKNLEVFGEPGMRPLNELPHAQIYNGFDGHFSPTEQLPMRQQLGIGESDVVFGMVARGIREKGWQYALDSFAVLSKEFPQVHLVFVGNSAYLDELKAVATNPRIHFVGFAPNPIDWVRLFDVGLLPSYFASESLPNSVAEYLFCGIPVVATRIGELPQMLAVEGQEMAGVLIEQNGQGLNNPVALTDAMRGYLISPAHLVTQKVLATQCFTKFSMERCVAAYEMLFATVQEQETAKGSNSGAPFVLST